MTILFLSIFYCLLDQSKHTYSVQYIYTIWIIQYWIFTFILLEYIFSLDKQNF